MKYKSLLLAGSFVLACSFLNAQTKTNKEGSQYAFTIEKQIGTTDVKNQGSTGTCWSFSSLSFLESEIERNGKGPVNLSEMYIARKAYEMKADKYIRMMGKTNFSEGGAFHDVMNVIRQYGLMPDASYTGLIYGQKRYNHGEMEKIMTDLLNTTLQMKEGQLNPAWKKALNGVLDAYLGEVPASAMVGKKSMTPIEYATSLGINADDYIELSSFTHHPFYKQFVLEVPDNWAWNPVYNVPLNELEQIVEYALSNNYSIAWAADVSEKGFSYKNGLAIVPDRDWDLIKKEEKEEMMVKPVPQMKITQEIRQQGFDNLTTQDDHGMHIVGMAKDQLGTRYYIVKNSWGDDSNECGGYFYCSASYLLYKTTCIMVHKNGIPAAISKKLGV
jgi:bleomycin hydrolase